MYITKETKCHPWRRCHDNSYATGPVSIKTKIPRFHLKHPLMRCNFPIVYGPKTPFTIRTNRTDRQAVVTPSLSH